jgi:hypothetical protein
MAFLYPELVRREGFGKGEGDGVARRGSDGAPANGGWARRGGGRRSSGEARMAWARLSKNTVEDGKLERGREERERELGRGDGREVRSASLYRDQGERDGHRGGREEGGGAINAINGAPLMGARMGAEEGEGQQFRAQREVRRRDAGLSVSARLGCRPGRLSGVGARA